MKKKLIVLAAVMALALMVLSGCGGGSDNPYVGNWEASKISAFGEEMTPSEAEMEWSMEIKDNGECIIVADGEEETATWEETEDGIKITFDMGEEEVSYLDPEDMAMTGKLEEDQLVVDFWGMMSIYMDKK